MTSSAVGAVEADRAIATMLPEDEEIGTLFSSKGEVMEKMPENPGFSDAGTCFGPSLLSSVLGMWDEVYRPSSKFRASSLIKSLLASKPD